MLLVAGSLIAFLLVVLLFQAITTLPIAELRRRARNKHLKLSAIYNLTVRPAGSKVFLYLAASALLFVAVIASFETSRWLLILVVAIALGSLMLLRLKADTEGVFWSVAKLLARPAAWFMSFAGPVFDAVARILSISNQPEAAGIYEKQDLLEELKSHKKNENSRLNDIDVRTTEAALNFNSKTIAQLLVPLSRLKTVVATEPIGPHLMDELYSGGKQSYLVTKQRTNSQPPVLVGVISMGDLVIHQQAGKLKDVLSAKVYYINEDQSPKEALEVLLAANQSVLAVVNRFNEITGALYLEDIIKGVLPDIRFLDASAYANPKFVASLYKNKSPSRSAKPRG